jgi:hypothetical protein
MLKPVEVKALPDYKLWLGYSDGVTGVVDLSYLVGQGVFSAWRNPAVFERVRLGEHGAIIWSDEIDLCPDSLYLKITGKTPEELFPNLKSA